MSRAPQDSVAGIGLGLTLYSFSNEWIAGDYTLETMLAKVAGAGIGPGVEIVGFQSVRGFPHVDRAFEQRWRDAMERYDLVPTCLGANIDVGIRARRPMDVPEMVDYARLQIEAASRLGFTLVRIQMGATPEVIERITPIAEAAWITLGMEIHCPDTGESPAVQRVLDTYERIDSPNLGFIPDFSATMHSIAPSSLRVFVSRGVPEDLARRLGERWLESGTPVARFDRWAQEARARGLDEELVESCRIAMTMNGHADPETWRPLLARTVHVHGKFYDIDANGEEPSIDYRALMRLLVDFGYRGYISSEWEGHAWHDVGEVDVVELIQRHHALERRWITAAAGARPAAGEERHD